MDAPNPQPAKPRPVGRPSKLDPATQGKLVQLIQGGMFAQDAAAAVGVGVSTFYAWLEKGRKQKRGEYREFREAIDRAQALRRSRLMSKVVKAAGETRHWQAAAWVLQHTDAAMFAPQLRVHVEAELTGALQRLAREFANEPHTYERILAAIAGGHGVSGAAGDPIGASPRDVGAGAVADPAQG